MMTYIFFKFCLCGNYHFKALFTVTPAPSLVSTGNESDAVRDRHRHTLYCYLICFWVVLLMKHCKKIYIYIFEMSVDKKQQPPDNMSCGKLYLN